MKLYPSFSPSSATLLVLNVGRKTTPRVNVYTLSLLPVFIFLLLLLHHLQRFVPNNPAFLVPTHHPAAPLLRHCSESLLYDGCNHGSILAHHDTRRIVNPVKDNHSVILSRNPSTVQQRGRRQSSLGKRGDEDRAWCTASSPLRCCRTGRDSFRS